MLRLADEDQLLDRPQLRCGYAKLAHPGPDAQLRPYVTSRVKGVVARRLAIDVAEACGAASLSDALLAVAPDRTEHPHARAAPPSRMTCPRQTSTNSGPSSRNHPWAS